MTPRESVSLNNVNLYILVDVNGNKLEALVDSRATVVINVDQVKDADISDEHTEVQGYNGEKLVHWKRADIIIIYQENHAKVNALVMQNVAY